MATQTPSTPESGIEAARSILGAALSGKDSGNPPASTTPVGESAPASTPAPTPSLTPPSEASPAAPPPITTTPSSLPAGLRDLIPTPPPPAPSPGTPSPTEAKPVPPSFTDPAAQRYLEMHGGNLEAALAKALKDNNRLGQIAKANPDLFKPGAPADPTQPLPPEVPALFTEESPSPQNPNQVPIPVGDVPPVNWEQITTEVDQRVMVDNVCKGLIETWTKNDQVIRESQTGIGQKEGRLQYLHSLLSDSNMELPELKKEELEDERRTLSFDLGLLKQDAMLRTMQNDRLDQQFRSRRSQLMDEVSTVHKGQAREQAAQAELKSLEASESNRIMTAWPGAITRVITAHQIPQDMASDFESYAKQVAQASLTNPDFIIEDVEVFLTSAAKSYVDRLDRYHRAQAARYGTAAAARAATPSPVAPVGTPAPPPTTTSLSPEDAMADASRYLRERLRG